MSLQKIIKFKCFYPFLFKVSQIICRKNSNINRSIKQDPVFIIGSGRNGSTLLASLLNNHDKIFFPPEQYALPYVMLYWKLGGCFCFNTFSNFSIRTFLKPRNNQNWLLKPSDFDDIKSKLKSPDSDLIDIIDTVYLNYAGKYKSGVQVYGDQSPVNTQFLYLISHIYPNAKFIFLVRDPRDVVLSYKKLKNNPASKTSYAVWKWKESIKGYYKLVNKNHNVLLLKYEDLVSSPKSSIKTICRFLNIQYIDNMEFPSGKEKEILGTENVFYHSNIGNPINTKSIGKWKEYLTKVEIEYINKKTQKFREQFGYE